MISPRTRELSIAGLGYQLAGCGDTGCRDGSAALLSRQRSEAAMDLLVNVDVDDLPKGIAFYKRAIGLQVGRRFGSFAVEMLGASSAVYLLLKPDRTRPSAEADDLRRYRRHWTPVHLDFVVADIAAAVTRATQMADPFGHGMCFIQFLGRGYDEIADRGGIPTSD
jgi:catechol 2,3-dioxygenase-like lactoylglutathione lyase family enzyme